MVNVSCSVMKQFGAGRLFPFLQHDSAEAVTCTLRLQYSQVQLM